MPSKQSQVSPEQLISLATICCGVGPGGSTSMVSKITLIDFMGKVVLDAYVCPTMPVTDYRTATTGIEPRHLDPGVAMRFSEAQARVASLIKGKVLIGHAIWQDLSVLGIPHPAINTRDVALYQPFRNALQSPNQIIGLQTLMWHMMRRRIQDGVQNSFENATAALDLYRSHSSAWEQAVVSKQWPCALPPSTYSRCYL
ncbi:hypothetical protein BD410DRAFT_781040 [Rickenella mellea]|uniref:Exonuclease domain-containing protein n=1 Tax=Rickenella mellea TaxID=50990 RepID=A0A4Y7QN88_9AGAM|nr:hypothetical protein BD410DRAFT_781040 [Rickenella mellea]